MSEQIPIESGHQFRNYARGGERYRL